MRVLITGARAPVAIEWARLLMRQGHQVTISDCCRFPLGRFLTGIERYIRTTSPRQDPQQYQNEIVKLVEDHQIQMLIPTCEEIFHLAQFSHLLKQTHCLFSELELLLMLHDKSAVVELLSGLAGVKFPITKKLTSSTQIDAEWESILKPTFCRFGEQVIRDIKQVDLQQLDISHSTPWVQQQKLTGQALCNYALFDQGKLIAHQVYRPDYCVNGSAATYFQPIEHEAINTFMNAFAKQFQFHGQVSFDFIVHQGACYVIECNPRATSGLHLVADDLHCWSPIKANVSELQGNDKLQLATNIQNNKSTQAQYIGFSMLIAGGLKMLFKRQTWRDFYAAKNALHDKKYQLPYWAPLLSSAELLTTALYHKQSLAAASTADIEWNGQHGSGM